MDTTRSKTALDDFETAALAKDEVRGGHADVLEADMAVAVGRIVVAVDRQHAVDGDSGGLGGDEDDGLLPVRVGVAGVTLAHDDVDLASGVTGAARPPFL